MVGCRPSVPMVRWADGPVPEPPGGGTARAGLAVARANDPAVLLADEPPRGLDDHDETRLPELLRRALSGAVLVAGLSDARPAAADRVLRLDRERVVS